MLNQLFLSESDHQKQLKHLTTVALDIIEDILIDTQTPTDTRLNAAFRVVELGTNNDIGTTIINSIESNTSEIKPDTDASS